MQVNKQVSSYYFHHEYFAKTQRTNCRQYRRDSERRYFVMANANKIEIYSLNLPTLSISYYDYCQFMYNIKVLEIIPSKHQSSDYIFIGDEMGRFSIWREGENIVHSSDQTQILEPRLRPYRDMEQNVNYKQYSGITYTYNVNDTEGYIMYVYNRTLMTISFSVKKSGFILHKIQRTPISYEKYKFVGVLSPSKNRHLVGIIQQRQQQTILQVIPMKNPNKQQWSLSKINLIKFVSNGNQIGVLTYNQVCIYKYPSTDLICSYRINQGCYNQISVLNQQKYMYLGSQMILFNKKGFSNYGNIKLSQNESIENDSLDQFNCIAAIKNQYLLYIRKKNSVIAFIYISQSGYKIINSVSSLSSIFNLNKIPQTDNILAITQHSQHQYQVNLVNKKTPCIQENQQYTKLVIEKVFVIGTGQHILVTSKDQNIVFKWENQHYTDGFNLPKEKLLLATNEYFVLRSGIYGINYIQKKATKNPIITQNNIIAGTIGTNKQYIGYQTEEGEFKIFSIDNNQKIIDVRSNTFSQYLWCFYQKSVITANYQILGEIQIINIGQSRGKRIIIKQNQIITDLALLKNSLFIGLGSGDIYIFSLADSQLLKINIGSELIKFCHCINSILVTCGSIYKLFQNSKNNDKKCLKSNDKYQINCLDIPQCTTIEYIPFLNQFLLTFSSSSKISLYKYPNQQKCSSLSIKTIFIQDQEIDSNGDIPLTFSHQDNIYIIRNSQILIYQEKYNRLIKNQIHSLKTVNYVEKFKDGFIIIGIDHMDGGSVIMLTYQQLQTLFTINLGNKKIPNSLKKYNQNYFILRYQTIICMYQIISITNYKLIFQYNTYIYGYQLDIHEIDQKIIIGDPSKYIIAYDFSKKNIIPISRYVNKFMVNDISFLNHAVLYGDRGGYLGILQFNLNHYNDIEKMEMTSVGNIYLDQQIFTLSRSKGQVYYGCRSGCIGRVLEISKNQYFILKRIQKIVLSTQLGKGYLKWRRRQLKNQQNDKLIDDYLIKVYLKNKTFENKDQQLYKNVKNIYQQIIAR